MSLKEYKQKRNFQRTDEPYGKRTVHRHAHRFVVQKHAASRLHYDFRLELDGVLKSWAVPKGMPLKHGEKRLAVEVEDHPVSYIDFEGTIPKGQYGGGTVMLWDRGTFEALTARPLADLAVGKLHFALHGQKLDGEWHLVRMQNGKNWLLVRGAENARPISKKMDDTSALSGRNMAAISKSEGVWNSGKTKRVATKTAKRPRRPAKAFPSFIEPMKARLVAKPPGGRWLYEIKLDGFRTLAFVKSGSLQLLSRNEKDFSRRFPQIQNAVEELDLQDAIIDGEIVALDSQGRSSFQLLQAYDLGEEKPPLFYYAFDLLRFEGRDLTRSPLIERKDLLKKVLIDAPEKVRYCSNLKGDVSRLLKEAQLLGLEGLIGKRADSIYEPGRRSGAWIKLKLLHEQEFVIGGFTDPEGSRKHFGSLLVGYFNQDALFCAGRVGTGFNDALLDSLAGKLNPLAIRACPFENLPEKHAGRYGAGITANDMKRCHWVKPRLVCQVKFFEWTRDGKLRQPVFIGLREDKPAGEVMRETAR
jgi:bifunctional non-homologous end joining protein LigD